jgi:hypothetical protein
MRIFGVFRFWNFNLGRKVADCPKIVAGYVKIMPKIFKKTIFVTLGQKLTKTIHNLEPPEGGVKSTVKSLYLVFDVWFLLAPEFDGMLFI